MRANEAGRIYISAMSISIRTHGREKTLIELNEALKFMSKLDGDEPVIFDGVGAVVNVKEAMKHIKIRVDRLINIEKVEVSSPLPSQNYTL
ncbi:MAG: hypothetical protein NWQ54_14145 [Paraglaciecola sp.]|nr:hypothetical protein [Paraglaciecola sp.]